MTTKERIDLRQIITHYYNDNLSLSDNYKVYLGVSKVDKIPYYSLTTYRNELLIIQGIIKDKYTKQITQYAKYHNTYPS